MKIVGYVVVAVAALLLGLFLGGQRWGSTPQLPSHAPAFELIDLNGRSHTLADYQGELLLLNFWATWCVPCRAEMPRLQAAHQRYQSRGLNLLGPALDETPAVAAFVAEQQISYPIVVGDQQLFALMDGLGDHLGALPFTVLIGRDGQILERHWGELDSAQLESLIEKHI